MFQIDLVEIKASFLQKYHKTLYKMIQGDCSGDYKKLLLTAVGMNWSRQMCKETPVSFSLSFLFCFALAALLYFLFALFFCLFYWLEQLLDLSHCGRLGIALVTTLVRPLSLPVACYSKQKKERKYKESAGRLHDSQVKKNVNSRRRGHSPARVTLLGAGNQTCFVRYQSVSSD